MLVLPIYKYFKECDYVDDFNKIILHEKYDFLYILLYDTCIFPLEC